MIGDCLMSLKFSDEIIVVDTGNTDATNSIACKYKAKIVKSKGSDYSQFRNAGLAAATGDWVLYVDADERVTPLLKKEIEQIVDSAESKSAYALPRKSIILGREMNYGGWGSNLESPHNSYAVRLLKKSSLKGYRGMLHEQPEFEGELGYVKNSLVHITHRDLSSMLEKTLTFTNFEAKLRLQANHPPVVPWRVIRVMLTEFRLRFVKLSAWRDGVEGIVDGVFQVFNSFVIYARLWEMQQAKNEKSRNL